jgi:excinuclease ABC subunit A
MPIEEGAEFFEAVPAISRHLKTLTEVGLGYVRLGQPAPTLSGGEAQRVKLASELQKRSTGRTVYVLDEPTTGLHFEDVRKLLGVLDRLVDAGNTVIVIEHNLDVIKTSDWVIDMGPEGGKRGGTVVAEGSPEDVAAVPESHTGRFLAEVLATGHTTPVRRPRVSAAAAKSAATTAPVTEKAATEKPATKKAPAKKAPAKKAAAGKAPAKNAAAGKAAGRRS